MTCMQAAHVEICWVFLMVLSLLSHFSPRSSVSTKPSSSNPVLKWIASIKDIYIYILAYLNHSQPNNSGTGTQESCAHDPDIPAFLFEGDRQELLRTPVYHGGWWDETFAGLHLAMVSFLRWEHVRSLWFLHGQDAWLPALPSHFPFIPKIPQRGSPPGKQRGRQPFHQPGIA